jgi:undecaprenol kinase
VEKGRGEWHQFYNRMKNAGAGIGHGFKHERNLHIQGVAGLIVVVLGFLLKVSREDWIHLFLLIGGVISLELVNTSIERTVDLITSEHHPLAKAAKDTAAGAVLFFSIVSLLVGGLIFSKYLIGR